MTKMGRTELEEAQEAMGSQRGGTRPIQQGLGQLAEKSAH